MSGKVLSVEDLIEAKAILDNNNVYKDDQEFRCGSLKNVENHLHRIGIGSYVKKLNFKDGNFSLFMMGIPIRMYDEVPADEVWHLKNGKVVQKIKI